MRLIARLTAAALLGFACAWVPLDAALACSCAFPGYPDVVAAAEIAFVGTVIDEEEPRDAGGLQTARYLVDVRLAKAPIESPIEIDALFDNGVNCGVDMNRGEEWLVLASVEDGRPTVNLCGGSTPTAGVDPETQALLAEALRPHDDAPAPEAEAPTLPMPLLVGVGAAVVIGLASFLAFRHGER
jgi:hypothetical protein